MNTLTWPTTQCLSELQIEAVRTFITCELMRDAQGELCTPTLVAELQRRAELIAAQRFPEFGKPLVQVDDGTLLVVFTPVPNDVLPEPTFPTPGAYTGMPIVHRKP